MGLKQSQKMSYLFCFTWRMKSPLFDNVVEGVEVIGESRRSGGCRYVTSIDIYTICDLIED